MKNLILSTACAAILAISASAANADILYQSPMTAPPFTAGDIVGQDGWAVHSGLGGIDVLVSASGTSLVQGANSREDVNRSVTAIAAGQTYYYGFDVAVTGGSLNVYFAHFLLGNSTFQTRAWVTADAGGDFTFALSSGGSITATWATPLTFGDTYRVVGAYDFNSGTNRLWVDPVLETDTNLSVAGTGSTAFSAFALRQAGGNSTQVITNLAVGTSFADVVAPVPEPSTYALLGSLGAMGLAVYRNHRRSSKK